MKGFVVAVWILFVYFFQATTSTKLTCPPPGFDSVSPFSITQYIAASWYIQEQRPVVYQPVENLFCVVATYDLLQPDNVAEGLVVMNYANQGGVNGPVTGTSGSGNDSEMLQATLPDVNDPSKLLVGPPVLETLLGGFSSFLYGDYWIVAVGPSEDPVIGYDWAIVSGGPPRVKTENGCRTGRRFFSEFQTNDIGLWLFSRKPVDPENTQKMRSVAQTLGFDITVLRKVEQDGCKYEGAILK